MVLLDQIQEIIKEHSNDSAIIYCDNEKIIQNLTYKLVDEVANTLYTAFKNAMNRNNCIGILMEHTIFTPSLIISLLKHQCTFMFLNPHVPNDDTIKNVKLNWVLSTDADTYKTIQNAILYTTIDMPFMEKFYLWKTEYKSNFENITYIVETSATTGKAKIVKVEHFCIESNINCLREMFHTTRDLIYFGTPLTFDPSMIELFLSLTSGSCLVFVPQWIKLNPPLLLNALFPRIQAFHNGVSMLQMAPSVFLRWKVEDIQYILQESSLKTIVLGGEKFPKHILKAANRPTLSIYNIYGITEVSCWASIHKIEDRFMEVPIGAPLDDTILEVRDENKSVISDGIGELYVGSSIRICYIDNEQRGDEKQTIFRPTGDLVKICNKELLYIGRNNDTIKRFGHRVNLNELEETIFDAINLENKLLWLHDELKLVLFVQIQNFNKTTIARVVDKIRVKLLHSLPNSASPDFIEILGSFPLTKNGKINKSVLKDIYMNTIQVEKTAEPQEIFKTLIKKYFGLNDIDVNSSQNSNFFEIGGNSILAIQLLSEFQEIIGSDYPNEFVTFLFEKSLQYCYAFIENYTPTRKRSALNEVAKPNKKRGNVLRNIENIKLRIKWKYDLKACVDSSAVVFQKNLVAIGSFSHIFAVLKLENGEEHFKLTLPDAIESSALCSSENISVYTSCYDGKLYNINSINGEIIWEYATADRIKNTPTFCLNSEAIAFGSYDKHFHCVQIKDGKLLWKAYLQESVTSSPIYISKLKNIFVATIYGKCFCISENNGDILWIYKSGSPIFGSPCTFDCKEKTFVVWPDVQGTLHCINCSNGEAVWKFQVDGHIYSTLIKHDKNILFGSQNHTFYCLEYTAVNCVVRYHISLDSSIIAAPSIISYLNKLYVVIACSIGNIYIIDLESAEIVDILKLKGEIFSSPVCVDNNILIGCRDNNLYCVEVVK